MLGYGDDVFGAGVLEELRPLVGAVVGDGEEWDEVFVTEFVRRAVVLGVPGYVGGIHVLDVPLVDARGDGVEAPVDEDAELGGIEPRGGAVLIANGGPGGLEGPVEVGPGLGVGVGRAGGCAELGMKAAREKRGGRGEQGGLGEEGAAGERYEGKGSLWIETLSSRKHWWPL
jgi:hypothetical protein